MVIQMNMHNVHCPYRKEYTTAVLIGVMMTLITTKFLPLNQSHRVWEGMVNCLALCGGGGGHGACHVHN